VDGAALNAAIRRRFGYHCYRPEPQPRYLDESAVLLAEYDERVILVNHFEGFNYENHTIDGVHPNRMGAQLMAERWFHALISATQRTQVSSLSEL